MQAFEKVELTELVRFELERRQSAKGVFKTTGHFYQMSVFDTYQSHPTGPNDDPQDLGQFV